MHKQIAGRRANCKMSVMLSSTIWFSGISFWNNCKTSVLQKNGKIMGCSWYERKSLGTVRKVKTLEEENNESVSWRNCWNTRFQNFESSRVSQEKKRFRSHISEISLRGDNLRERWQRRERAPSTPYTCIHTLAPPRKKQDIARQNLWRKPDNNKKENLTPAKK